MTSRSDLTLYEATDALLIVEEWIAEHADDLLASGGELPPALAEVLDVATADLEGKVERVALKVRELTALAEAVKAEADRLTQRAKVAFNAADALKRYLHQELTRAGQTKVTGVLATVRIQRNSQPSVTLTVPVESLPPTFQKPQPPVLNRDAVVEAFKAGQPLPEGVEAVIGTHLRIQ